MGTKSKQPHSSKANPERPEASPGYGLTIYEVTINRTVYAAALTSREAQDAAIVGFQDCIDWTDCDSPRRITDDSYMGIDADCLPWVIRTDKNPDDLSIADILAGPPRRVACEHVPERLAPTEAGPSLPGFEEVV